MPPDRPTALIQRLHHQLKRLGGWLSLQRAKRLQRRFCGCHVVITGSVGKTTAAKLTNDLLAATGASVAAGVHMNNGRYLWRSMSKLRGPTDFVVQELGAAGPGDIARLTDHLPVDVAVITAVGHDHYSAYRVSYANGPDAIAVEKGRLAEAVGPSGLVCLNADDSRVAAMAARTQARVVTYGRSGGADLRATDIGARWPDRLHFTLQVEGRSYGVRTRFVGTLMLPSVLAALAVVHGTGRDLQRAIDALAVIEPARRHMSIVTGESSGRSYVVDIEKASLWSTELLAEDMDNIGGTSTVFVLGEMSDMGSGTSRHYARLARSLSPRVDRVILAGEAASAEQKVRVAGLSNVFMANNAAEVAALVAAGNERLVILKSKAFSDFGEVIPLVEQSTPPQRVAGATGFTS